MKLKNKLNKGVLNRLLFYGGGFILAYTVYLIFGWDYIHAPGFHHIIGLLFLVGGVVFLLRDLVFLVAGKRDKVDFGFLLINGIILASILVYLFIEANGNNVTETKQDAKDIITITTRDSSGFSSLIDGNEDTLYLRNDVSVLIDTTSKESIERR
jgi:hypothetical protein